MPSSRTRGAALAVLFSSAVAGLVLVGCRKEAGAEGAQVTVYCSVDEGFARPVLEAFEQRAGIRVTARFDTEAGKTTGLVNRIVSEAAAGRPQADVFWSSEVFNTVLLARRGLLAVYDSPAAADIPARFRDEAHRWTALAVRARVIAFDPKRTAREEVPTSWEQLAAEPYVGDVAFANPLFGTTRGHVAAMFAYWGPARGRSFLEGLKAGGALISDSNSATVRAVIAGRARFGATDTDDVWVAQRAGESIDLVYPDMGDGGTLLVPTTVAIVKGARHPEAARKVYDYLVSAEVERMLAESDSRNIPVRAGLREELGLSSPAELGVDYGRVADAVDEAMAVVRDVIVR